MIHFCWDLLPDTRLHRDKKKLHFSSSAFQMCKGQRWMAYTRGRDAIHAQMCRRRLNPASALASNRSDVEALPLGCQFQYKSRLMRQ